MVCVGMLEKELQCEKDPYREGPLYIYLHFISPLPCLHTFCRAIPTFFFYNFNFVHIITVISCDLWVIESSHQAFTKSV